MQQDTLGRPGSTIFAKKPVDQLRVSINAFFQAESYTTALRFAMNNRKEGKTPFTSERLAAECRVQASYLSRVFKGRSHLADDQLYLADRALDLDEDETRFLFLLKDQDSSLLPDRKASIFRELDGIRKNRLNTEQYIAIKAPNAEIVERYYLNPHVMLVHMFLSVPRFQQNPDDIAKVLQIAGDEFAEILLLLKKHGLVYEDGDLLIGIRTDFHLDRQSPKFKAFRQVTKMKSCDRLFKLPSEAFYSFSATFNCDDATRLKIQNRFLELLQEIKPMVDASPNSEVYQINFDLFDWSHDY